MMRHRAKAELKMFCLLQCLEAGHSAVQSKYRAKPKFKNFKKNRKKGKLCFETQRTTLQAAFKFLGSVKC